MNLKKGSFFVKMRTGPEKVTGYIDAEAGLTYHKDKLGKCWICSDYRTGQMVSAGLTRQQAADVAEMRHIRDARYSASYQAMATLNE